MLHGSIVENIQQEESWNVKEGSEKGSIINTIKDLDSKNSKNELDTDTSCLEYSLIKVYQLLVKNLIYSPENAHIQLQRDNDPQAFERLLSSSDDKQRSSLLKMKDLGLPDEKSSPSDTLRFFAFNIQRYTIEKVKGYIDNSKVHVKKDTLSGNDTVVAVYQKKSDFYLFNRSYHHCVENMPQDNTQIELA